MSYALSLIVPALHRETADLVAVVLGHAPMGKPTYVLPLSADGSEPATHWQCHALAEQPFIDLLAAAAGGVGLPPVDWSAVGTSEAAVYAMAAALLVRARGLDEYSSNGGDHRNELGLQVVQGGNV